MISESFVKVNGRNTSYKFAGSGQPVLLIHGSYRSSFIWHRNLTQLAKNYFVIAPDRPGYGKTKLSDNRELPDMVEFIYNFTKALNLPKIYLIGESRGGGIAIQFASKYPDIVQKLCLIAPIGLPPAELPKPVEVGRTKWEWFVERSFGNREIVKDEVLRKAIAEDMEIAAAYEVLRLENLKPNYRTEGLLREMVSITCPTLLVWGRDDPVFPVECTERFNHIMPTIKKTIIFDHARHLPFFEYPEPFNTAVADFFSK